MATTLGIWGLGCVGMSAVRFFGKRGYSLSVMNNGQPTPEQATLLAQYNVRFFDQDKELKAFFAHNEVVLPSPGIDLRPYSNYLSQCTTELDVLNTYFHKPIIAITGTLGKTSTTHLLTQALIQCGKKVGMGGNVGIAMLDLSDQQDELDYAVLELSSFQLEHSRTFAPDLAIITNIFPNHLDRHGTFEQYQKAKLRVYTNQRPEQQTIMPVELYNSLRTKNEVLPHNSTLIANAPHAVDAHNCYYQTNMQVYHQTDQSKLIADISHLSSITFSYNATLVAAALDMLGYSLQSSEKFSIPEHRIEYVATVRGVAFYNDSKSTLPQATQAALDRLVQTQPSTKGNIILFLGGLDKGVDRAPLIQQIAQSGSVKMIYAFGSQAHLLTQLCTEYGQQSICSPTLEQAFTACTQYAQEHDVVLFSPSGASFDLFAHYEQRGSFFKQLVHTYAQENSVLS